MKSEMPDLEAKTYLVYNFKTQEDESMTALPSDWTDYVPQEPLVQCIYRVLLVLDVQPMDAALAILTAYICGFNVIEGA